MHRKDIYQRTITRNALVINFVKWVSLYIAISLLILDYTK